MTSIRSQELNGVLVYNCTAGKSTPEWTDEALKSGKSLRYNEEFRRRIDIIQDFNFPQASQRIKMSPDGQFIGATGTYKPQFKCFDVHDLTMKFDRFLDCEAVQFQFLDDDYSKIAFLRHDRTVEIHAQGGRHHNFRIPKFGRDMTYLRSNCDMFLCGSSDEVYRFNLDRGSFLAPLQTNSREGINALGINPVHHLVGMACENGTLECWDPRDRQRAAILDVAGSLTGDYRRLGAKFRRLKPQITSLRFHTDAYSLALGTSTGQVLVYDLRSAHPIWAADHRSDLPVHSVKFHEAAEKVVSSDAQSIKIWDKRDGAVFTSVTPNGPINDLHVVDGSGLMMTAGEELRCQIYYIPRLGHAPKWVSFLDNLTEELEERKETTIYDDYQFVTREELEELGLSHLIGTKLLKAYMHGFWMDLRLYYRAKSVAAPKSYEEYLQEKVKSAITKRREANRIIIKKNLPQVNRELAQQLLQAPKIKRELRNTAKDDKEKKKDAVGKVLKNPLMDERFAAMFEDADFEIDKGSADYRRIFPSGGGKSGKRRGRMEQRPEDLDSEETEFDSELEEALVDEMDAFDDEAGSEESDGSAAGYREGSAAAAFMQRFQAVESEEEEGSDGEELSGRSRRKRRRVVEGAEGREQDDRSEPKLFELREGHDRAQALSGFAPTRRRDGKMHPAEDTSLELSKRLELRQAAMEEAEKRRKLKEVKERRQMALVSSREDDELYDYTNPGASQRPSLKELEGHDGRRRKKPNKKKASKKKRRR